MNLRSGLTEPTFIRLDPQSFAWEVIGTCNDGTQVVAFEGEHAGFGFSALHKFDSRGHHLETIVDFVSGDCFERWPLELPGFVKGEVFLRPFRHTLEQLEFGLIPRINDDSYTGKWMDVVFEPYDIHFIPPWDGAYET